MALDLHAYLERIGYDGPVEPTLEVLDALHLAHATTIPFENIDILLGRPIRLDLPSLQDKLVRDRRGGYCFEHNTLFAAALEAVGFGGGSILRSLPMGPGPVVDQFGWRFRLVDDDGARVVQTLRPRGWIDLYAFTFEPQFPVDYEMANHFTSTHPNSPFTRTLTVQLCSQERSLILRDRKLIEETPSGETVGEVRDDELLGVLAERFTLSFPPGTRFDAARAGS